MINSSSLTVLRSAFSCSYDVHVLSYSSCADASVSIAGERVLLVFCAEVFRETDVRQKLVFSHHVIEVFIYHCCGAAVFNSLYKYRVTALCVDVFVHRPVL